MVNKLQKRSFKLIKKYFYNLLLTYQQWLVCRDGRKACFKICKAPFIIELKYVID